MDSNFSSRPSTTTMDVESLVGLAWRGQIRVPHFQRDFRWSFEDVRRLFDSIIKGYPIGSLLLWAKSAPAQELVLGDLRIDAPAAQEAYWVVDGQQRLTSLANALHPSSNANSRFAIAYDLRIADFVRLPSRDEPHVIPLNVLFDLQRLLRWFSENQGLSDYLDQATSVTRRIRQFEIPAYLVAQDDPAVLRDIFDRMNNFGKRLTRAEIFSALNAGDEADVEALTFDRIADEIDADTNFGVIDSNTVLAAVLAPRGSDVRRDVRKEFESGGNQERDEAYKAGAEAISRAVRFLQTYAEVPHVSMLAYRYLLVVLARYFAYFPRPSPRNLQLLRRWYWRAAVAGPEQFKGGTPNAARVLCTRVHPDDETGSVLDLLRAVDGIQQFPNFTKFNTADATTKMLLCSWWSADPRDPVTGAPYQQVELATVLAETRTARPAVRTLLPRGGVAIELRQGSANRALMPTIEFDQSEVSQILSQPVLSLEANSYEAMVESHLLTSSMINRLQVGDYRSFIEERQVVVNKQVSDFLSRMCEFDFEDTPPISSFDLDDDEDMSDTSRIDAM